MMSVPTIQDHFHFHLKRYMWLIENLLFNTMWQTCDSGKLLAGAFDNNISTPH